MFTNTVTLDEAWAIYGYDPSYTWSNWATLHGNYKNGLADITVSSDTLAVSRFWSYSGYYGGTWTQPTVGNDFEIRFYNSYTAASPFPYIGLYGVLSDCFCQSFDAEFNIIYAPRPGTGQTNKLEKALGIHPYDGFAPTKFVQYRDTTDKIRTRGYQSFDVQSRGLWELVISSVTDAAGGIELAATNAYDGHNDEADEYVVFTGGTAGYAIPGYPTFKAFEYTKVVIFSAIGSNGGKLIASKLASDWFRYDFGSGTWVVCPSGYQIPGSFSPSNFIAGDTWTVGGSTKVRQSNFFSTALTITLT